MANKIPSHPYHLRSQGSVTAEALKASAHSQDNSVRWLAQNALETLRSSQPAQGAEKALKQFYAEQHTSSPKIALPTWAALAGGGSLMTGLYYLLNTTTSATLQHTGSCMWRTAINKLWTSTPKPEPLSFLGFMRGYVQEYTQLREEAECAYAEGYLHLTLALGAACIAAFAARSLYYHYKPTRA